MDFKNILNTFDKIKSDTPKIERVAEEPRQQLTESVAPKKVAESSIKVPSLANVFRELMEADVSMEPVQTGAQVIKKDGETLGTVHNPAVAGQIKSAVDKGEISFGDTEIKEAEEWIKGAIKDPGAFTAKAKRHGMSTKEFANYVLSHKDDFPSKTEKQANLAKTLGKMKEGEMPPQGPGQASPLTFESKKNDAKRDDKAEKAGKKVTKDLEYDMGHKGKDDNKAEKAGKKVTKEIEYDEWKESKLPPMSRVKKMCKDGLSEKDILKHHPKCDKKELKDLIKKCKSTLKEGVEHIIKAARHMGKAHGLNKHSYANPHDSGTSESRAYHEGYVEGLDECMGIRNEPIVGMAEEDEKEVVDTMASYGAMGEAENSPDGDVGADDDGTFDKYNWGAETVARKGIDEDDMEEGNAFTAKLAATPKGGEFELDGKKYKDTSALEENEWTFESLQAELDNLLNEDKDVVVNEGVNINVSTGNEHGPDTVSVSATDAEADKLLKFVKSVGLGVYGDELEADAEPTDLTEPGVVSFYGAPEAHEEPKSSHDDMLRLLGMMDEPEMRHGDDFEKEGPEEAMCNECGMTEAKCGCNESSCGSEMEEGAQNPPDSGADNSENDEKGNADANMALATQQSGTQQLVKEKDDMDKLKEMMKRMLGEVGDESSEEPEQPLSQKDDPALLTAEGAEDAPSDENQGHEEEITETESEDQMEFKVAESEEEVMEEEQIDEISAGLARKAADTAWDKGDAAREKHWPDESDTEKKSYTQARKFDRYADKKEMAEEEEFETDPDATAEMMEEEKLDEWANDAGKKGTDTSFEQDIDFMTKVISGGLNKQKSTGQTTVPVIAGQKDRMGKDGINEGKSFKDILSVFDSLAK